MTCATDIDLGAPEYMRGVVERAREQRLPLSGYFDLTHRCNLRCAHCYTGHQVARPKVEADELTTDGFIQIFSEAVDAGCLLAFFSGGEPLLRDDFGELYIAARRLGLIVTVFTNATLINDEHVALFQEYPPHKVEASLYGASEQTYRRVTGVNGAFARAKAGIERLLAAGVRVSLKSMILKTNADDILAIEALAQEYDVEYLADPLVFPRLDGDLAPTRQRLEPQKAVEIEEALASRRSDLQAFSNLESQGSQTESDMSGRLYQCGAGVVSFHVDEQGYMRPCLLSRGMKYNVRALGFAEAWRSTVASVDGALWTGTGGCRTCPDRFLCGYCVAVFELEHASHLRPPQYVCELGKLRRQAVRRMEAEVACASAR